MSILTFALMVAFSGLAFAAVYRMALNFAEMMR